MNQSSDPLLRFRPEFQILEKTTYLISNSLGAMPRAAGRALAEYSETWGVADAGIDLIRAKSLRQTTRLIELVEGRGLCCATPRDPARRGGTAAVDFENALEVARELNAPDVLVDYRPGVGIRMSPHFYTEDAELDRAFAAIDDIRATGSWRRRTQRPSLVT